MEHWQGHADQTLLKAEDKTLIWTEPLPDGGRAVVKMYRRRGFLDPVRRWFVPYRVEREYRLLARLFEAGVPCAEPLRWTHGTNRRHGRHELLVTREIPATAALRDLLRAGPALAPDLAPLFAIARRMHDAGVAHGAFYAPNILVTVPAGNPPLFHVIDLAHGCSFSHAITGTPPADYDVLDMLRSIERVMPIDDRERWVAAYGLSAPGTARLLGKLARHRLERPWRHIRRARTDALEFLSRTSRLARAARR
jgi:tRNA A-37 threonylcarbamoyl transferase component Bud32